jgi:hypothetical protein
MGAGRRFSSAVILRASRSPMLDFCFSVLLFSILLLTIKHLVEDGAAPSRACVQVAGRRGEAVRVSGCCYTHVTPFRRPEWRGTALIVGRLVGKFLILSVLVTILGLFLEDRVAQAWTLQ